MVYDFFISKSSLSKLTYIPKKTHLQKMYDFRSISLCNIIYKIIANVIANKFKKVPLEES